MNSQKAWENFVKTGTVRDYLTYVKAKRGSRG